MLAVARLPTVSIADAIVDEDAFNDINEMESVLVDFVTWGAAQAPASRYVVQLWGHGGCCKMRKHRRILPGSRRQLFPDTGGNG